MSLCASIYMCFVVTCWERADLLALVCGVCCGFVTFPIGILGQVRYLIVSIPDLCTLTYFVNLFIVSPIVVGVCNCSMFCCTLLYVHSSFAIILMGKRELVALLSLSSWCLVIFVWLFLEVPWVCLQFVIVVFPNHTHFLFQSHVIFVLQIKKDVIVLENI